MNLRFENDVNLYGNKTKNWEQAMALAFENDVNLYRNKTANVAYAHHDV